MAEINIYPRTAIRDVQVLVPLALILIELTTRKLVKNEWSEEIRKALFSAALLMSVVLALDLNYLLAYFFITFGLSVNDKSVYTTLFGGSLALLSYISANPFVSVIPLSIMSIATPTAYFLSKLMKRANKGVFWTLYMFSVSTTIASMVLVSMGPINPLWGILIGAVATWSAKIDDSFAMPLFTLTSIGFIYSPLNTLVAGFGVSLIASSFAYYIQALDINGLISAVLVGTFVYSASPILFLTMAAFLVSSSILGKFSQYEERYQKKGKRSAIQVLSNSMGAVIAGFLMLVGQNALSLGIAAISAAAADTWATEIGSRSKRRPRMITTMKIVEAGRSGGITILGLVASLTAGLFMFLLTYPFYGMRFLIPAVIGGIVGSLFDSLLGATAQGMYRCRICRKATEQEKHCGKSTLIESGIWWLNNDLVNLAATIAAMVVVL